MATTHAPELNLAAYAEDIKKFEALMKDRIVPYVASNFCGMPLEDLSATCAELDALEGRVKHTAPASMLREINRAQGMLMAAQAVRGVVMREVDDAKQKIAAIEVRTNSALDALQRRTDRFVAAAAATKPKRVPKRRRTTN